MERTDFSKLGKVLFIERLTSNFSSTVVAGIGDDCAVIEREGELELISKVLFMEGVDFDLTYTPLEHLGLKLVTAAVSNITAMNGIAQYITIGVALSSRFCVEEAEALYRGVERGCQIYGVELIGGDTAPSLSGLTLSATAIGSAQKDSLTLRSGASPNEIVCYTGTLGGAYMGLKLLEREKRAGAVGENAREIFEKHKFILNRQLQPFARVDIVEVLKESELVPTAMIDITSGLASAALSLCKSSEVGLRLHLNKIPVNADVQRMCDEMGVDPLVAILNGGDDFELLFTLPASAHTSVEGTADIHIVGFTTDPQSGCAVVTPDGEAITLNSPDFTPSN